MSDVIRIPPGSFWMGSDTHHTCESPRHRVFVDVFEICATTVTRSEYRNFLDQTLHHPPRGWEEEAFRDDAQPVVGVSWFDAIAYCRWRSRTSGEPWRLPTESEWERACRGGSDAEYSWGDTPPECLEYYQGKWLSPRRVAEAAPNGYGLFNMGDNVHEWCFDWYDPDYYGSSPQRNPKGPTSGSRRVSRGGSWRHAIKASRAAHRSSLPPEYRYCDYGFRLVRGTLDRPSAVQS